MKFKILIAAMAVAALPMTASALTLQVGGTTITDGGAGDSNGTAGVITFIGSGIDVTSTNFIDANGLSRITLTVLSTTASAGDLAINTTHAGFGAGEGQPTTAVFSLNGSQIENGADTVMGSAYVDDANVEFSMATLVGSGSISAPADDVTGSVTTNLSDPFSMSIFTTIKAGTTASYDATIETSVVPVPAGILLMGTALAGFGVMRRRKKAA